MSYLKSQTGYSLIELMVSITIGSFLILGAAFAFEEARKTYTTNDNVARLYEQAQYVTSLIDEDIRLANFWGLHNRRSAVRGDLGDPVPGTTVVSIDNDCLSSGWALDLSQVLHGTDSDDTPDWGADCILNNKAATADLPVPDTLVVRRAGSEPVDATEDGSVYIRSNESPRSTIFEGTGSSGLSTEFSASDLTYDFISHGYFVQQENTDDIPRLMRAALVDGGDTPQVEIQEVMQGVEDLQVQFGIDYDRAGTPNYGIIDRYVDPDSPYLALPDTRVLSVRYWLLLQSEREEAGYTNSQSYQYANLDTAYQPDDSFRRLLVSKTVQIRNLSNTN